MKIFTEKQVDISALLAGPIPPGILIYRNYLCLGKEKQAYIALGITLMFTVGFFYGIMQVPDAILDRIPNFVFTAFYGILVFVFFRFAMAQDVKNALSEGTPKGSNWTVAGITVIGLILNFAIIFGLAMNQPYYEGERTNIAGNELYFDQDVPQNDIDILVAQLQEIDFFGPEYGNTARLELINDEYRITLLVDEQFWTDDNLSTITIWKRLLEVQFGKKTNLTLESPGVTQSKFKKL